MRKEITEPLHWRTSSQRKTSWASTRRRSEKRTNLAANAVDAAFAEEPAHDATETQASAADILTSLSSQLTLLEAQQEHLQKLLAQAKKS